MFCTVLPKRASSFVAIRCPQGFVDLYSGAMLITDVRSWLGPVPHEEASMGLGSVTGSRSCSLLPWWCAQHRFLPSMEDLDDAHESPTVRARFTQRERDNVWLNIVVICVLRRLNAEPYADFGEIGFAGAAGHQVVMTDAVEPVRKDVDRETSDKHGPDHAHNLLAVTILDAVVFPSQRDVIGISADQAVVRDGDAVGIAAQVGKYGLWATEGRFRVDHPFGFAERIQPSDEGVRLRQPLQVLIESHLSGLVQGKQPVQKEEAEPDQQVQRVA